MTSPPPTASSDVVLERPSVDDGAQLWQLARDSQTLDVNSSYAYLLWCRDFSQTSIVARRGGSVCGFVTGYVRPDAPDTLFVWQVAVAAEQRGQRLARRMIDHLVDHADRPIHWLETTITADNAASIALFTGFARDRGASVHNVILFTGGQLSGGHDDEVLYRIGPLGTGPSAP